MSSLRDSLANRSAELDCAMVLTTHGERSFTTSWRSAGQSGLRFWYWNVSGNYFGTRSGEMSQLRDSETWATTAMLGRNK
eukprot:4222884-Heterocapsa_arctica.AAC.1